MDPRCWLAVPAARVARVLRPYRDGTTLVGSARSRVESDGVLHLQARTRFGDPVHRPGTATLDPVEANILYNQMLYLLLGEAVVRGMHPLLQHWTWADFLARQLPNVLILQFDLDIAAQPRRDSLRAAVRFTAFTRKTGLILLQTQAVFCDQDRRAGRAAVAVALVDRPPTLPAADPR